MTGRRITLPRGYRLDKAGRLLKSTAHLDVSRRLQKAASKRVRVVKRTMPK